MITEREARKMIKGMDWEILQRRRLPGADDGPGIWVYYCRRLKNPLQPYATVLINMATAAIFGGHYFKSATAGLDDFMNR